MMTNGFDFEYGVSYVFYSNHSPQMHCFSAMGKAMGKGQTDGQIAALLNAPTIGQRA